MAPRKRPQKPRKPRAPRFTLDIATPANGRFRKSEITVRDTKGSVCLLEKADLASLAELNKAADRMADKLKADRTKMRDQLAKAFAATADKHLKAQAEAEAQPAPAGDYPGAPYVVDHGRICWKKFTREGDSVLEPLCNFVAAITEEVVLDDGSGEAKFRLAIDGTLDDGAPLPRAEVSGGDFGTMNWTLQAWGCRAIIKAGMSAKDRLREAIQDRSRKTVRRRTIYQHTGWRKVGDDWVYLHADGVVMAQCRDCREKYGGRDLPGALQHARLPDPPKGDRLAAAVRASLAFLDLADDRITFSCLGAVYRAVLGACNVAVHLSGRTGSFKSETAALLQQHWGTGFDAGHLPANWSSTANANEGLAFLAKDMLLTIDDFAPNGTAADVARMHKEAERIIRNVGNHASRHRMNADGSLRMPRPPRCLILSTGEEVPKGHSIRARLIIVEIEKGEITSEQLTRCQKDAAAGLYAECMAAFVAWLAPQYEQIQADLSRQAGELRDEQQDYAQHRRTPANMAQLLVGLQWLLRFAAEVGAIDERRRQDLDGRARVAFSRLAAEQSRHLIDADPVGLFMRLVRSCLSSGRAHVCDTNGDRPGKAEAWGWREQSGGVGEHAWVKWQQQGSCIGWLDADDEGQLYLDPEAAHAVVQRLAQDKGETIPLTTTTLGKRLNGANLLASTDKPRETLTIRRLVCGVQRKVWHLRTGAIYSAQKPDKPDIDPGNPEKCRDSVSGSMSENPTDGQKPDIENRQKPDNLGPDVGNVGFSTGVESPTAEGDL